jgi:O-antigen ligase
VASRSLKNLQGFRDALMGLVVAAMVLSAIGVFEYARHWLLYNNLEDVLGAQQWGYGNYLERGQGGSLRALGSVGQPIAFGYVMAVAAGFLLYLRKSIPNPMAWRLGLALLIVGLIACLSRGPWVGAAAMLLVFVATGRSPGLGFAKLGLLGAIIVPVLLASPLGEKIVDLLPFVGTVEEENVVYRQRLVEISIQVIMQNPFFGAFDSVYSPAMQELKQGQGIIDIVNSYLAVALGSGLVGLSLFSGFFVAVAVGLFKGMRNLADRNSELYLLGQVLFATLLGILVIIYTVSSISVIPVIYWSVAGLGVAYARMLALENAPAKAPETAERAGFRPVKIRT